MNGKITSNGSNGGNGTDERLVGGGGSGGGSINILYKTNWIGTTKNLIANGGRGGSGSKGPGGAGGNGSITVGSIATGTFVKQEM